MSGLDHGMLNLPLHKRGRTIDQEIETWKRDQAKRNRAAAREATEQRKEARQAEKDRPKLSREDLDGARLVRDQFGWHRVARVNKTTVSVETGYSWVDRIPFVKVLEARR